MSYHFVLFISIIPYNITSHHITSHHITSNHIISHHITSVIAHDATSNISYRSCCTNHTHDIKSYQSRQIISHQSSPLYHTISHHINQIHSIISYHISYHINPVIPFLIIRIHYIIQYHTTSIKSHQSNHVRHSTPYQISTSS